MATNVDTAKREQPAAPQQRGSAGAATPQATTLTPGINPQDFIRQNRIHVKGGSLFIDPYLVLHPRELAPENETALRKKLQLTYTINNPSFYESSKRTAIALNLGQLLPVTAAAKRSKLMDEVNAFNAQAKTGVDTALEKELANKQAPFAAIAHSAIEQPQNDPVGMELLQNGLAMYLLVREKLTLNGYLGKLTDYVERTGSPDQVLADLGRHIGVDPLTVRATALKGGVDGVGKLLGLDPRYIRDVKELAAYAATQDFSYNLVEHWHLGRQLQGIAAPMAEKITTGLDARITAKIAEYRDRIRHRFDVPEPVKAEEARIGDALNLVEPIQRELMQRLGYEICYSPEISADDIAFFPGVYGLHRRAANDLRQTEGTYRIYFAGRGDLKGSMRTLVHEVAHNLWPEQFTPAEANRIDQLAQSDQMRFTSFQTMLTLHYPQFEKLFNAYKTGNAQEKSAAIAAANQQFAAFGFQAEGLFPHLREARDFQFAVRHAYDTLRIEGDRYNRSGYHGAEERFREVLSRFAELKQVEYRGEPQFLQFLAPGLNQVWENHYLPHLARVNELVKSGRPVASAATSARRDEITASETLPKVEERPIDPTAQGKSANAPVQACAHDNAPQTQVAANSIQLNPTTLAALNTLQNMGIASR